MAVTRGRKRPVNLMASTPPVSQQQEQIIRMRQGQSVPQDAPLDLAAPEHSSLRERLLALEAQVLARAPKRRRTARLRLV